MEIKVVPGDILEIESDGLLVNLFEGVTQPGGATGAVDKALNGLISQLIADGEIKGKANEVTIIHTMGRIKPKRVAVLGLGKRESFGLDRIRSVVGEGCRRLRNLGAKRITTIIHGAGAGGIEAWKAAQAITEGCLLGLYRFDEHKSKQEDREVAEFLLVERDESRVPELERGVSLGRVAAEATNLARDLTNQPANFMTPTHLAQEAEKIAHEHGLGFRLVDKEEMARLGMGALLGVARGSHNPPVLIVLEYRGGDSDNLDIGFVGKGVTFDSGGISIKPSEGMADMKGDMAGAAAVIAAMKAIALLKPKLNIIAVVPATENLPGGAAYKPGDILKSYSGKTIEVVTTDAEGRLILADALSYARSLGAPKLVDLATLTGACHIALGDYYSGAFGNDQELLDKVVSAGREAGERHWVMPIDEDYKEQNKSDVADIKNSGGRWGGAITAALFLAEFVEDTPWVHLDIAGTFRSDKDRGYLVKGATGVGVRTLINLALRLSEEKGS